jgi:hypothetical protein
VEAVKSTAFVFKVELSEVLRRNTTNWIRQLVTGKKIIRVLRILVAENGLKNCGMQQNSLWSESDGDHTTGGPEVWSPYRCAETYRTRHFTELCFYLSTPKLSSTEELTASN